MAFKLINNIPGVGAVSYLTQGTATAITAGNLLSRFQNANRPLTNANVSSTGADIEAIAVKTETTTAGDFYVRATPLLGITYVVADTTADTSTAQLNKRHLLTNMSTVNNSSTENGTTAAVFTAIAIVGTTGTKKLFGYLSRDPQA